MRKADYQGLNLTVTDSAKHSKHHMKVHVEGSTRCPLLCPGCTRTKKIQTGQRDFEITDLNMDSYRSLIDSGVREVVFNLIYSDPIWNSDIFEQVQYAKANNTRVTITTNASGRSIDWWEKFTMLFSSDDKLVFSVDGLANTNHIYRVNSNWHSIYNAMKTVNKLNSKYDIGLRTMWKFIVFNHNWHQVEMAHRLSSEIGMGKFSVIRGDRRTPKSLLATDEQWNHVQNYISKV